MSQPTPLPETGSQTGHNARGESNADPRTPQDSHSKDNSEDASMVTGLSSDASSTSSFLFFDKDKVAATKLKKKSIPKRANGKGESFVWLWLKGSEETTPQDNLCTTLTKVVTVISSVDSEASFQCVYDDSNATWTNPDTKETTPVTPIKLPEEVPTAPCLLEKYFEVQWERMMTDRRGRKDKKGKPWKQMNISRTLLLSLLVCDKYL